MVAGGFWATLGLADPDDGSGVCFLVPSRNRLFDPAGLGCRLGVIALACSPARISTADQKSLVFRFRNKA